MLLEDKTLSAAELMALPPTLFFQARGPLAIGLTKRHYKLLAALADHAKANGWPVRLLPFVGGAHEVAATAPQHIHIFLEDRPFQATNVFHATPGYLRGFWFFDGLGSRNNATQRMVPFLERAVPKRKAEAFFADLAPAVIAENRSKFTQPDKGEVDLQPGSIAFFAQGFQAPRHHSHFMTVPAMIEAAIAAKGKRPLYIKPHPSQTLDELEQLVAYDDPQGGVHVVVASIHDLLAGCDLALTLTSAVGFEAFLHRKPVILGGQTDFWHNAVTLTDPAGMAGAVDAALTRDWPYETYLYWYLQQHCVDDHPRALPQILAAIHRRGYALGDAAGQGFF